MSSPTQPLPEANSVGLLRSDIASDQDAANQPQGVLTDLEQYLSHLSIGKRSSNENPFRSLENEIPRKRRKTTHLTEEDRYVESTSRSARKQRQALRLQAMRREHNLRAPPHKLLEAHGNSINLSRSVVSPFSQVHLLHSIQVLMSKSVRNKQTKLSRGFAYRVENSTLASASRYAVIRSLDSGLSLVLPSLL